MKKYVYTFISTLICLQIGFSQQLCSSTLFVSLDFVGEATISADILLEGNMADYSDLDWTDTVYTCDDIGTNPYTISGNYQGAPFTCTGEIIIEDKLPPIVVCEASAVVNISANTSSVSLDVNAFDNGTFDNCGLDSLAIDPAMLFSSQIGTIVQVTLTAYDSFGNSNSCITEVTVSGTPTLSCIANLSVVIVDGNPVTLYPSDVLVNANPVFNSLALVISQSDGSIVQDNTLTISEIGDVLTYQVTDVNTGNSCWGTLTVSGVIPGEGNAVLACNSEVNLYVPPGLTVNVSPDMILEGGPYDYSTLIVEVADQNFSPIPTSPIVDYTYAGQTLLTTVTDTVTNNSCWGTLQVELSDTFFICDTESRCTVIGDCSTGHSAADHVEWPCDLDLFSEEDIESANLSVLIQPSTLVDNFGVDTLDIQPNVINYDNDLIACTYVDQVFVLIDHYKIIRTWTILDWIAGNFYTYNQIIRVNFQPGPIECTENVVVALSGFTGTATLYPEIFVNVNPFLVDSLEFYPSVVTCEDVGEVDYLVSGIYNGTEFLCEGTFAVEDKLAPIPYCNNLTNVVFSEGQTTLDITPDMIDAGSFDTCSEVTLSVEPNQVTADQIGTLVDVTLTVTDADGNTNYCVAKVAIQGEGLNALYCVNVATILPAPGLPVQLYAEDFLVIPYAGTLELVIYDQFDNIIPNNLVSTAYADQDLTYLLTDIATGDTCLGIIQVASDDATTGLACCTGLAFYLTEGSSIQVDISDLVSPGSLALNLALEMFDEDGDAIPNNILTNEHIGQVISFTVLDIHTGNTCWATFTVEGSGTAFFICDTEPRCTPYNDCENGHSENDNIEWPCDIEIYISEESFVNGVSSIALPANLELSYGVDVMDSYPTIVNYSGDSVSLTFEDTVIDGSEIVKVLRTWIVLDWISGNTYEFVQLIKLVTETIAETEGEISDNAVIQAYPNPVVDWLSIKHIHDGLTDDAQVIISNVMGRQVLKEEFKGTHDVSHLETGTYHITIIDNSMTVTKTFIKL